MVLLMKLVLIYSGGLDSSVLLYHLRAEGHEVRCLGIDYGQRHRRELQAGRAICERTGIEYRLLDLSAIRPLLGGSALTDALEVPAGPYTLESMKTTVVPNRNMILLALALAWAVSLRADGVAYAAHAGDHPVYPDCRPEFIAAFETMANLATKSGVEGRTHIRIHTPPTPSRWKPRAITPGATSWCSPRWSPSWRASPGT